MDILPVSFYNRDTITVAKELIGKVLIRNFNNTQLKGIITETEAYCSDDPACHAYNGKTKRNAALFGPVGHTYVYFTYGCHYCVNIVARDDSVLAGGVLIRAIQPLEGLEIMQELRGNVPKKNLANGPGKLTQALAITRKDEGLNVSQLGDFYIVETETLRVEKITVTKRIGISRATERLWRFVVDHNSGKLNL